MENNSVAYRGKSEENVYVILYEEHLKDLVILCLIKKIFEKAKKKNVYKHLKVCHLKKRLNLFLGIKVKEQEPLHESFKCLGYCSVSGHLVMIRDVQSGNQMLQNLV